MATEVQSSKPGLGATVAAGLALFAAALIVLPGGRRRTALQVSAEGPRATPLEDGARPLPVRVSFSGPAARLDRVGKDAGPGVRLEPPARGRWVWESDRDLVFSPQDDWPVGQAYRVKLDAQALAPGAVLASRETGFVTAPFAATFAAGEFQVDPRDAALKRVAVTLSFSHPADVDALRQRVSLSFEEPKKPAWPVGFTVKLDKLGGKAFVTSDPLSVPEQDSAVRVRLAAGARSWRGGPGAGPAELSVRVPSRYGLLSISRASVEIVRDDKQEPQQMLVVEATAGVDDGPLSAAVSAWVLPEKLPAIQDRAAQEEIRGWSPSFVGPEVLALSTRAVLSPAPADQEHAQVHAFGLSVPPGKFLYVAVDRSLEGYGGYALAKGFATVLRVPEYPTRLDILHDGAILSAQGRRALTLAAEGVKHVRFEAARVLESRVSLLASQSEGSFADPSFAYVGFGGDDLSELFEAFRALPDAKPGRVSYFSFDFSPYLRGRHGLFFFRAEGWDPVKKKARGPSAHRLILVTDLGMIVKDAADGSHDVFVQRLSSGRPAAGARVEVLGRNGLTVLSAEADESGRARFPKLADFKREKTPVAYLARLGDDLSFLPFARGDRRLDFSRFDVGGAVSEGRRERLEAYLFTDRGLYRPGELIHAAALVRSPDWAAAAGTPLEAVVQDPRGLEVQKTKIALSSAAFEELSYRTEESGLTGGYAFSLYTVKDGRRSSLLGSVTARVEEFLPDTLRIRTSLGVEREDGWVSPEGLKGRVSLRTLYGTQAEGRRVSAQVSLAPAAPLFKGFPGFRFFDPAAAKKSFSERLEEKRADARGEAEFDLDLGRFAGATYRLTFSAEGFDEGAGRGVASQSSVLVSPRPFLVGFKPDGELSFVRRGSTRSVEAAAVGPEGKALARGDLRLDVIETRWVSALVKQESGLYKYQSVERRVLLSSGPLSLPAAPARLPLPTDKTGDFALVVRDRDGLELNRLPFSVAGAGGLSRPLDRNAELKISLDKADYAPGEEINVHVRAPYTGAGLITIERDRVYAHRWFRSETTSSVQKIRLPEAVEGNAYVNVEFLRSPDSPEIYMSPLSYGAAPFSISRARRSLPLELSAPEKIRPGQTLTFKVRAARPATVAVWAVDEGILQAAGYVAPDPLGFFLRKRALEVRTFQLLDLVLPEYESGRSSPGGDKGAQALGRNLNPFKRKTEPPAVYWAGLKQVGEGWTEFSWTVPDYFSGSARLLAVAASPSALGVAQASVVVRGPIVLSPSAPTFAAPGDELELSVSAANGVPGSGPDAALEFSIAPSGHLEAIGPTSVKAKIGEGREGSVAFRLRAKQALGSASVRVTASNGAETVARTVTLSVRPGSTREVTVAGGLLGPGASATAATPRRLYPQYRVLEAVTSPLPLALARGLLDYLHDYPHLCTEQLVSQAIPALVLRAVPGFGYAPEATGAALDRALRILRARQNADGAFGYWAANAEADPLVSAYAMHFLLDAQETGVPVAAEMLKRGDAFLLEPGPQATPRARAYALYLLTRQGRVTTDALEALRRETEGDKTWRRDVGAAYLAASYKLLKLDAQAERLMNPLALGQLADGECDYARFYDPLSRDAQLLYLWARHFPERVTAMSEADWDRFVAPIMENRFNTLSSAYTLLAFGAVAQTRAAAPLYKRVPFAPSDRQVSFKNETAAPLFYGAVQSGFDLEPPAKELREKLEVFREYLDADGRPVASAKVGDELTVRLRVRSVGGYVPRIALIDLLPGGLEASAERGQAPAGAWSPEYSEVREDRVLAYGAASPDSADFTYKARAVARGRFLAPPAYAESMYDRSAKARTLPSSFEVR